MGKTFSWKHFLFSPNGRITRFDYWVRYFIPTLILFVGGLLADRALGLDRPLGEAENVSLLLSLLALYPSAVILIKRFHDRNKRGWWVLIYLVPIVGWIWAIIELGILPGTAGENRFGPDMGDRDQSKIFTACYYGAAAFCLGLMLVPMFVLAPYGTPSGSMIPTLLIGDYVYVSKYAYGYSRYSLPFGMPMISGRAFPLLPERGDVAVLKLPRDNKTDYLKRIVGLPGDKIQMKGGILHINGEPVRRERIDDLVFRAPYGGEQRLSRYVETLPNGRSYLIVEISDSGPLDNTEPYMVPPNHLFTLGDNRDNSADSRDPRSGVGYVPIENLVGRAEFLMRGSSFRWVR